VNIWHNYKCNIPKDEINRRIETLWVPDYRWRFNIEEDHIPTFDDPDPQWGDVETWIRVLEGDYAYSGKP